jgi:site-specific recombinase XerD
MGIRLGHNWCFEISRGIGGSDPYHIVRLRKPEQDRLLEVARSPTFGYGLNDMAPPVRSAEQCARDQAIVTVMLYGGIFHDQVAFLKTNAIATNLRQPFISYLATNGVLRQHPLLSHEVAEAVDAYLAVTSRVPDSEGTLFVAADVEPNAGTPLHPERIGEIILSLMREVPVHSERASVFALRNSFAKAWIDSGRDVGELQNLLDLESGSAMQRYIGELENKLVNPEQEELVIGDWRTNVPEQSRMTSTTESPIACLRSQGANEPVAALLCPTGDAFICCVLEDEAEVALPLARALLTSGLRVRLGRYSLQRGETLDLAIADGFARCSYGIVILSQAFIGKKHSARELSALFAGVRPGSVLPVWHNVTQDEVQTWSPIIARMQAVKTEDTLEYVAFKVSLTIRLAAPRT